MIADRGPNYRQVPTCSTCRFVTYELVGDEQVPYCDLARLRQPMDGYAEVSRKLPTTADDYICDRYAVESEGPG